MNTSTRKVKKEEIQVCNICDNTGTYEQAIYICDDSTGYNYVVDDYKKLPCPCTL